jgi:hypothetical protein
MIIHPIQKTKARSGMAQIFNFFTASRRSSSAGIPISNLQLFCNQSRPLPGRKNDNF